MALALRRGRHLNDVDFLLALVVVRPERPARIHEAQSAVQGDDRAVDGPLVFG